MFTKVVCLLLTSLLMYLAAFSAADHSFTSKYVSEVKKEIKSLSESDIVELRNGRGWGLAKVAELNGMPGPVHLLEMKDEINLSSHQVGAIDALYKKMKQEAIPLGLELIELERQLNNQFANRVVTSEILSNLLERVAQVQKKLRFVHLSAHLKTPDILSSAQIALYNKLRGYSVDDPCANIPDGHAPGMWKRHHNCPSSIEIQ
jgi:hypothetical protein